MPNQKPKANARAGAKSSARTSNWQTPKSNKNTPRFASKPNAKPSVKPASKPAEPKQYEKEMEAQTNEQIIFGKNAVTEALLAGSPIDTVYIKARIGGLGKIVDLAKERGIVVKEVSEEKLERLGASKVSSVAAELASAEYSDVESILALAHERNEPPFIIIADEIEDPHNLGAIIRSAEAAGAHGVIIPKRRSASLNATVYKTSAGAAAWMKVARVANLSDTIRKLKEKGIWVYGAEADGTDIYSTKLEGPIALVIGSEGKGLGQLVRRLCDGVLSIPMYGQVNSLNASVSAGILMYEVVRNKAQK